VHMQSGAQAAIKVLPASMARESGFVARFNREIDAMRQLSNSNENIVELYESGEEAGTYYYAMEYVPGETLTARLLREKRIPWRDAIEIAVQICRALKAAHNAGVVHRDLKPSNLLLRNDGVVKLADFGVAQVFATSKLTVTGGILGTAEYMSPEQAQGSRATRQSDIYSLGAVLYVMLTGRPPFTGKSTLEIAQKHKFSQFDSPRRIVQDIPHWLDEVVCKCLSKKPEDRYPDAYVLGLRLQEIPKKVDLAMSEADFDYDGQLAPDKETEAANAEHQAGVGGTIIRDMMRAEIEKGTEKSPLGSLLDNVWVLVGLFVLVIGLSGWLLSNSRTTPDELFERGQRLMDMAPGPGWDAAEAECFQPLLDLNDPEWNEKVAPLMEQIDQYQYERDLLRQDGQFSSGQPLTQPDLILRHALTLRNNGEIRAAEAELSALLAIIDGNPEFSVQYNVTLKLLTQIQEQPTEENRFQFLDEALKRAEELDSVGEAEQARAVRQGIIQLYQDNPEASEYVERARKQ
ncbi:MAG: serine/threonine protein kinase, partial [Planctomycetaceae bacterium]|nr:serine/threonine protein kinase [Planctomycetaceae bacterium]